MRWIKELVLIFLGILFQSQWGVLEHFDILALFSFYLVLRFTWFEGAFFALLGGLVWDSLSGAPLGSKTLALVGSCALVGLLHSVIYQEHVMSRMGMVFTGTFLVLNLEWLFYTIEGAMRPAYFFHSFTVALWTSFLAIFIYPILNRIFGPRYERWMAA